MKKTNHSKLTTIGPLIGEEQLSIFNFLSRDKRQVSMWPWTKPEENLI